MKCINLKHPDVKKKFDIVKYATNSRVAYDTFLTNDFSNHTIPFDKASNGKDSKLFQDLLKAYGVTEAIRKSVLLRGKEFKDIFGDWQSNPMGFKAKLDENGEPVLDSILQASYDSVSSSDGVNLEKEIDVEFKERLKKESIFSIGDLQEKEIIDVIDSAVGLAFKEVKSGNISKTVLYKRLRISFADKAKEISDMIEKKKDTLTSSQLSILNRAVSILDNFKDTANFNKLVQLVDLRLDDLGYSQIDVDPSTDIQDKTLSDPLLKEVWNDDKKWSIPLKDTIQFQLKLVLSGIRMYKYNDGVKSGTKVMNSILYPKRYDVNILINDLVNYLNSTTTGYSDLISKLRNSERPEFIEVADVLESDMPNIGRIRNAFVSAMARTPNNKITVLNVDGRFVVYKTDKSIDRKYIVDTWFSNQSGLVGTSDVFEVDDSGNISMSAKGVERLGKKMETLRDITISSNNQAIELKNLLSTMLGIMNSPNYKKATGANRLAKLEKVLSGFEGGFMVNPYFSRQNPLVMTAFNKVFVDDGKDVKLVSHNINDIEEAILNVTIPNIKEDAKDSNDSNEVKIDLMAPIIKDVFDQIGMDFNLNTIKKFLKNPNKYMHNLLGEAVAENYPNITLRDLTHIGNKSGGINVLHTLFSDVNNDGNVDTNDKTIRNNNPLRTRAVTKVFTYLKEIEELDTRQASFINGEGNQESSFGLPSMLTDIFDSIKKGNEEAELMLQNPFSSTNIWLNNILSTGDIAIKSDRLELVYLDVMKDGDTFRGKKKKDMSPREQQVFRVNLFANNNAGFQGNKLTVMNPLVFSDKSRDIGLIMPKLPITPQGTKWTLSPETGLVEDISLSGNAYAGLASLVYGELRRANAVSKSLKAGEKGVYSKAIIDGYTKFFFFPEMNDSGFVEEFFIDGEYNLADKALRAAVKAHIERAIGHAINETILTWRRDNLVDVMNNFRLLDSNYMKLLNEIYEPKENIISGLDRELNKKKLMHLATELVVNEFVANGGMIQLLADPAEFYEERDDIKSFIRKAYDGLYKRLGGVSGPRAKIGTTFKVIVDGKEETLDHSNIAYVVIDDVKTSRYAKEYAETLNKKGWDNIEVTDGQEFTTLREHIINLYGMGRMDDAIFNSIYTKIVDSYKYETEVILTEDEEFAIMPQKPLYTGHSYDAIGNGDKTKANTMFRQFNYVKSSSLPLLRSYTKSNPIDALRISMERIEAESMFGKNGKRNKNMKPLTVRAPFLSAYKTGAKGINKVFNEDFSTNQSILDNLEYTVLDRKNFGMQQEESRHEDFKIHSVSQMNKLIHLYTSKLNGFKLPGDDKSYTGVEMREKKEAIRNKLVTNARKRLMDKLGYKNGEFTDANKLFEYIKEKALSKGINPNELENIKLKDGKFIVPLYLNKSFNSIISSLLSDISNGVLRPKISGRGYTQVSNVGMMADMESTETSDTIFTDKFDGRLKYTRYENGDLKYAQVLVSRELFEQDSRFNLSDRIVEENGRKVIKFDVIDEDLFKLIGARIPNQKHSSMLTIEIVGLLPEGFEDTIIVPDEITKQMGSDFDIDHLYAYFYNYKLTYDLADEVKDTTAFEAAVKEFEETEEYDMRYHKMMKNVKRKNYKPDKAKAGIAKNMGLFWNVADQKLYSKIVNSRLRKITKENTKTETKDVLENEYIDIHHSILNHPEVVKMMTSALDYKDTVDFVKEYLSVLESRDSITGILNPLGYEYNIGEFKNNQGGKTGIAIQSNFSMLYSLLETNPLYLKDSSPDNETGGNFYFQLDGMTLGSLGHGKYTYKGEERTNGDIITMLQNEAVDNAKNKRLRYLGYTDETSGMYNLLIALKNRDDKSLSLHFIAKFMNQPIMQNILSSLQNNNDMIANSYMTGFGAVNSVAEELASRDEVKEIEITEEILSKSLRGELTVDEFNNLQFSVAKTAANLYKYGENLQTIFQSINDETASVGKDLNDALARFYKFNNFILENKLIGNVVGLVGTLQTGETRRLINKTEMGNNVDNGHLLALRLWKGTLNGQNISLHGTREFSAILNKLLEGKSKIASAKQIKAVETFLTNYIVTNVNNPLLYNENGRMDLNDLRERLLFGDNSMFNRIKNYLSDSTNNVGREFLSSIEIVPTTNIYEPKVLKYNVFNSNSVKEGILTDSFINLLMGNDEQRELGYDLLRYSMVNGWSFTSININRLLPSLFINNTNIGESLRAASLDDIDIDAAFEQMVQHYPDVLMFPKSGKVLKGAEQTNGAYIVVGEYKDMPSYFKVYSFKKVRPFKRIGKTAEGIVYKVLDNLGTDNVGILETQNGVVEAKSVLPLNKPYRTFDNVETRYELPTFKPDMGRRIPNTIPNLLDTPIEEEYGLTEKVDKHGIQTILGRFSAANTEVAQYFSDALNSIGEVSMEINNKLEGRGRYKRGTVYLNPERFFNKGDNVGMADEFEETVLHELTHAITGDDAQAYEKGLLAASPLKTKLGVMARLRETIIGEINRIGGPRAEAMNAFFEKVRALKEDKDIAINAGEINEFQPLLNLTEFIAGGASNIKFLESIADIEIEGKSVFEKIIDALLKIYEAVIDYHQFGNKSASLEVMKGTLAVIEEYKNNAKANIEREATTNPNGLTGVLPYKLGTLSYSIDFTNLSNIKVERKSGVQVADKEKMRVLANVLPENGLGQIIEIANTDPTKTDKLKYSVFNMDSKEVVVSLNGSTAGNVITSEDILDRINKERETKSPKDTKQVEVETKVKFIPKSNLPEGIAMKEKAKTDYANLHATKYIGFGDPGSTTHKYASENMDVSNTGRYTTDDVVFISVNGGKGKGHLAEATLNEIKKAMDSNVRAIITDNRKHAFSTHNTPGEGYVHNGIAEYTAMNLESEHIYEFRNGKDFGVWYRTEAEKEEEAVLVEKPNEYFNDGELFSTYNAFEKAFLKDEVNLNGISIALGTAQRKAARSNLINSKNTGQASTLKKYLKESYERGFMHLVLGKGIDTTYVQYKINKAKEEEYDDETSPFSLSVTPIETVTPRSQTALMKEQFNNFRDTTTKQTIKELERELTVQPEDYYGYDTVREAVVRATELNEISEKLTGFYVVAEKNFEGNIKYFIGNSTFNSISMKNMEATGQSYTTRATVMEIIKNEKGYYSPKLVSQAKFIEAITRLDDIKLKVYYDDDSYFYSHPAHGTEYDLVSEYNPDKLAMASSMGDEIHMRIGATAEDLLHEIAHSLAMEMLESKSKEAVEFTNYFNELKDYLISEGIDMDEAYGLKSVHEFVSEIASSEDFIELLNKYQGVRDKDKQAGEESLDELSKQVSSRNNIGDEAVAKVKELLTFVAKSGISRNIFVRNLEKRGLTMEDVKTMNTEDAFLISREYNPGQKELFMQNQNRLIEYTEINYQSDLRKFNCKYQTK